MKKAIVVAIYIFFGIFFIGYRAFYFLGSPLETLVFKALASLCFVLLAFFNYFNFKSVEVDNGGGIAKERSPSFKRYSVKIIFALCFSFAADILIKKNLVSGILAFLLAQICFFLAFLEFKKITLRYILLVFCVASAIIIFEWFCPFFNIKELALPLSLYAFFVVGSALKSIDALGLENKFARLVTFASILFLISDLSLQLSISKICSLSWAGDQIANNFSNAIYYAAQFLFAGSLGKDFIGR